MLDKVIDNQTEIVNTLKLLLYKENPGLLEKVDFDDDNVFLEPLLFAYFNSKATHPFPETTLGQIMQGYFVEPETVKADQLLNSDGIAYVPRKGYFEAGQTTPFAVSQMIPQTPFEVIEQPVPLLKNLFRNPEEELIPEGEITIGGLYPTHQRALTEAFRIIREYAPAQYELIAQCCKKVLLFKTDPENGNSFATINAHGIAFFNVYQDDYDVAFFVDDIAHQTGHIILTTLFYDRKAIFRTDENLNIGQILKTNDYRNFYTLFHALYTYYTTFMCLSNGLENEAFTGNQKTEAMARIGFYLNKCAIDLMNFDAFTAHYQGITNVLTNQGIALYEEIKDSFKKVAEKWHPVTGKLNFNNQSYNFSFSIFAANNPIQS